MKPNRTLPDRWRLTQVWLQLLNSVIRSQTQKWSRMWDAESLKSTRKHNQSPLCWPLSLSSGCWWLVICPWCSTSLSYIREALSMLLNSWMPKPQVVQIWVYYSSCRAIQLHITGMAILGYVVHADFMQNITASVSKILLLIKNKTDKQFWMTDLEADLHLLAWGPPDTNYNLAL